MWFDLKLLLLLNVFELKFLLIYYIYCINNIVVGMIRKHIIYCDHIVFVDTKNRTNLKDLIDLNGIGTDECVIN